jgi:large subunit ribosomal protein L9
MQVILLEKFGKLGDIGDEVKVKAGYGRNYLIPQGKAVFATDKNKEVFESRRTELEASARERLDSAQIRASKLAEIGTVKIKAIAGDEGKLFGSIGPKEIEQAIIGAGGEVTRSEINMPEGSFRSLGSFEVDIKVHSDIVQTISLVIESQ